MVFRTIKTKKSGNKQCQFIQSGRKNTWFANSKLPLEDCGYLTVLWNVLPFPRQKIICNETGCSSSTVVDWSSYCREVCVQWCVKNSEKLGGFGMIVEIDEAKFGKRKYHRGRVIEGKWVFGGFERETKKIFLVPVEKRDTDTLIEVIKQWINPGTIIVSDCWKAYNALKDEQFQHLTVNHSLNFVNPDDERVHTQNIERTWRDVRGGIPRYGRKENHFIGYLGEFLFKKKFDVQHRIHNFFKAAADVYKP